MAYSTLPTTPTIPIEPFQVSIPSTAIDDLRTLLRLSRIPRKTFESVNADRENKFGMTTARLVQLRDAWLDFDWRKQESYINSHPQYLATPKTSDGKELKIHFAALFSKKKDAIPIILSHGWPGSFMEFYGILDLVKKQYTPETLPYHLIVPSLPGYAFSSPPPLDRDFSVQDIAFVFNNLMTGLGFGGGYAAQGGDIGSFVTNALGVYHEECKSLHTPQFPSPPRQTHRLHPPPPPPPPPPPTGSTPPPPPSPSSTQSQTPADPLLPLQTFGYALEQGTRPSTIGITVSTNPLSLISWIGEKYDACPDQPFTMELLLTFASLYWFTDSFSSSIYPYRYAFGINRHVPTAEKQFQKTPTGYSVFPYELFQPSEEDLKRTLNLVYYRQHKAGGHFAALGEPETLWGDVEEFVRENWDKSKISAHL
ncbi:hypothetical protein I350_01820 [Cryptococcus amylolentus CBS 6273]|uniref:Epoxide hydrolase N-terminal domain-containing protein n=1 Tax=Cryptococcus amylolentus CBS 6273 TaxID=1296118 RepID=A0A1E3KE19_9TREE|nr:hypothetical protein I350_01820 [Cryptococcus amylolentus CBS 6273]